MWISTSWRGNGKIEVKSRQATNHEKRDGKYGDVPAPGETWLSIDCGIDMLSFRVTDEQLAQLYEGLRVALREADLRKEERSGRVEDETIKVVGE